MATVRWLTWKGVDEVQVNDLRPTISLIGKREGKQTDRFAPSAPPAKKRPRSNECDNSNFAMPCTELAYLTRTAMHAFTPPDTPAKRGKLVATVAGRDLPVRQLQHPGHRKSFVHRNSAIVGRVLQFNLSTVKSAGHQAGHYWQRKLLHGTPTTHVYSSTQAIKLGSQAEKQPTPRTEL